MFLQPLFLYMAEQAVHSSNPWKPLEAPWKYVKNFQNIQHNGRRTFAGSLRHIYAKYNNSAIKPVV